MKISRAWAHDSNDVSHLTISHLKVLKKFAVVWWYKVIIVSALSLSLRIKERFRDWEIERAWQWKERHILYTIVTDDQGDIQHFSYFLTTSTIIICRPINGWFYLEWMPLWEVWYKVQMEWMHWWNLNFVEWKCWENLHLSFQENRCLQVPYFKLLKILQVALHHIRLFNYSKISFFCKYHIKD